MSGTVVVGVDGSPSSLEAVDVAAREAKLRGGALHVVHAFVWPTMKVPLGPSTMGPPEGGLRNLAHRTAEEAAARAKSSQPTVEVSHAVIAGEPLSVLATESRGAALVVVGDRGLGGFTGLLVGSVAVYLTAHAECPVLVTRGRKHPAGPVVLGVDGSEVGDAAVGWAFKEASLRGAELVALHNWNAWTGPVAAGPSIQVPTYYDVDLYRAEEERVLATAISARREEYPDVRVTPRLVQEYTRQALIAASEEAQLLVVGARGRGGFTGLLLGSVSQAVLHHAYCPVAVVRADREHRHGTSHRHHRGTGQTGQAGQAGQAGQTG
ncbi:universal stress protein [Streptomyces qinglanensis]|uniref:Nucleotide-binding universal stress protein, UspA family n=1 Tax=Streptomyces qinglanensis TaxID=943816 RepID=A0A1H9V652_9ACTN|nr:universal stress protein [Streptomyces qinglanensis]SES16723.1 Nucleotide-binding universal stress protein, UspA family [Streptomyces qinglanensis]